MGKKRRNKKVFAVLTFSLPVLILFSSVAYADYDIVYDGGDNPFYVNGYVDLEKQGQLVTLRIKKNDEIIYIKQTETNLSGNYSFCFDLSQYGEADVLVFEEDIRGKGTNNIYKSTPTEVVDALKRLNSEESKETVISEEWKTLQIEPDEFNRLKTDSLLLQVLKSKHYTSLKDFKQVYNEGKFLVLLHRSTSAESAKALAKGILRKEILEQKNAGRVFINYTAAEQTEIFEKLYGKAYNSVNLFYQELYDAVILHELLAVRNVNEKFSVIKENNDSLGLDLSLYELLGTKAESLKQDLVKLTFSKAAEIKDEYNNIYKKYADEKGKEGNRGSGGNAVGGGSLKDVSIDTSMLPAAQYPQPAYFKDLTGYEWASEAIGALAANGVITGREANMYVPDGTVTRAELVKMVVKACGLEEKEGSDAVQIFEDVPQSFWGYECIAAANKLGVIQGVNTARFVPNANVTRQDMTVICYRALAACGAQLQENMDISFTDADLIALYAKKAVLAFGNAGLINGRDNSRFAPNETASRAEAAKLVYELWKLARGKR